MLKFNQFVENNGDDLTVISVSSLEVEKINEELDLFVCESNFNPYIGWKNSQEVLSKFGVDLPNVIFESLDEGEEVVILNCEDTDYYFYYCFYMNEEGSYESFATITDESELEELIEEE